MTLPMPADPTRPAVANTRMHLIERIALRPGDAAGDRLPAGEAGAAGLAERVAARQEAAFALPVKLPADGPADAAARVGPSWRGGGPPTDEGPLPLPGRDGLPSVAETRHPVQPPAPLPVLDLATLARAGMAMGHQRRTRVSEEYRITAGRILRGFQETAQGWRGAQTVMVTSALPGEGKSFSSLNIAGSIAQHRLGDVVLVDIDLKPDSLSSRLGLADRPGFLDLMGNPALAPEGLAVATEIERLWVVPIGTRDPEHLAVAGSRQATAALERLSRAWPRRLLVLDAPPCLSASDPNSLAPVVDQTVLVIEAGRTQRSEVEAALDLVKESPAITLLLNKARLDLSHTFGANGDYGSYF